MTPESNRQFALARQSAAQFANIYARAGFAVVIDDVIDSSNAETLIERALSPLPVYKVLLRPKLQETLKRNAERMHKAFDTSVLVNVIERIYCEQNVEAYQGKNWLIMDSSNLTVDETVEGILLHFNLKGSTPASD